MGRYYRTANPANITYAFQPPAQEFANAVGRIDQGVDTYLSSLNQMKGIIDSQKAATNTSLGKGMSLPEDQSSYSSEISKFESGINQITSNIMDNPLQYGSQTASINNLRRQINTSLTSGALYWFNKNYNTAKNWIKKNKNIDTRDLNAVYENALSKWGGTINKDGEYNDIANYLPQTVYGTDVNKQALSLATKTDKKANLNMRAALISNSLKTDPNVYNTELQRLNTGLYTDSKGETLDPTKYNDTQKQNLINNKIYDYAKRAALLTQDYTTKSGDGKISDRPAVNIGAGTDEMMSTPNSPINDIVHYSLTNNVKLTDAISQGINNYDNELKNTSSKLGKVFLGVSKQILENQANKLGNSVMELKSQNPSGNLNDQIYTAYNNNFNMPVNKTMTPDWGSYGLTVGQKKNIIAGIKNEYYNLANIKNEPILSSDPSFNGKTLAQIEQDPNILKRNVTNTAEAQQKARDLGLQNEYIKYGNIMPEPSPDGKNWQFSGTDKKGNQTILKDANGNPVEIPMSYGNKYSNFTVDNSKKPDITSSVDNNGNPYIRIPVIYNGKSTNIYVPSNNTVSQELFLNNPAIAYFNGSKTLYDRVLQGRVPVKLNDNMSFDFENGKPVLKIGQNTINDENQIEKALTLYLKTINGNSVTK